MIFDNLEFLQRPYRPDDLSSTITIVDVARVSDSHWLTPQRWFERPLNAEELSEVAVDWIREWHDKNGRYPGEEPPAVYCYGCNKRLVSDTDTTYQFDNCLWIALHGGYGMFTDSMAGYPTNSDERYIQDTDGGWVTGLDGSPIENPHYEPTYEEERITPGRPDHECVICHECAHDLCVQVPWLGRLINPVGSHAHRSAEISRLLAEGHKGWDLDRERERNQSPAED